MISWKKTLRLLSIKLQLLTNYTNIIAIYVLNLTKWFEFVTMAGI